MSPLNPPGTAGGILGITPAPVKININFVKNMYHSIFYKLFFPKRSIIDKYADFKNVLAISGDILYNNPRKDF